MTAHQRGDVHRDAILAFIEAFRDGHGRGPELREIAEGIGTLTKTGVYYHVRLLREAGCVAMDRYKQRTLRVVET